MFVDASAIIAIIGDEPEATRLAAALGRAREAWTSSIALFEAVAGLARIRACAVAEAEEIVRLFLQEARVQLMDIGDEVGRTALVAFERFGKGRHRAALNMGDCFAYGCARQLGVPLLFKGDDFSRTDIEIA
jgi:ribonuclease VapC